jgi:hypothetical protein
VSVSSFTRVGDDLINLILRLECLRNSARTASPNAVAGGQGATGLREAVVRERVFRLWTHPENLVRDRAGMFGALRAILEEVATLRNRGPFAS